MSTLRNSSRPSPPIAELVSLAATLLALPGAIGYFLVILAVSYQWVDVRQNLLILMVLALFGIVLFLLSLIGLAATLLQYWRTQKLRGLPIVSLTVHGGILLVLLVLWGSGWQIAA